MHSSYKGSSETKKGKVHTNDSHYELRGGHEKGGIKGSKKGIKNSFAGRHLSETEHHARMGHTTQEEGFPNSGGDGPTQM